MDDFRNQDTQEQASYKTGATQPPKKHTGLIACLLVAVILLGGIVCALGAMNIQLFRMLKLDKERFVSLLESRPGEAAISQQVQDVLGKNALGMTVDGVDALDQQYFQLPAGVLIVEIEETGSSAQAGLAAGDIILSVNGVSILSGEEFVQALQDCKAGDRVELVFFRYRTGKQYKATVILGTEEDD